ncbi:MAG: aldo/keto reductase [bacterium]|nr:aldo/keto reductase [bacterium]
MSLLHEFYTLSNGIRMPKIGIGTYKLKAGQEAYQAVLDALTIGIRHIDSGIIYQNEQSVGQAIKDSGIPRENIFITSKVPPHIKTYEGTLRMFEKSLLNLGVDYIDLYIINAPTPLHDVGGNYDVANLEVYRALEYLYQEERVAAIGVSQFQIKDIENIIMNHHITPHVQQISFFIGHTQQELVSYCNKHQIQIQAFSPLAKGYLLNNPILTDMAKRYRKSQAQLALKYVIQKGVAPIPKSSNKEHLLSNTQLDFEIHHSDMLILDDIIDDPRVFDDVVTHKTYR